MIFFPAGIGCDIFSSMPYLRAPIPNLIAGISGCSVTSHGSRTLDSPLNLRLPVEPHDSAIGLSCSWTRGGHARSLSWRRAQEAGSGDLNKAG